MLVGIAPREAKGLDWLDGMTESNVAEYTAVARGYEQIATMARAAAAAVRDDPASLLTISQDQLPDPDQRVVADRGIRSLLLAAYAEALRISEHGWDRRRRRLPRAVGEFDPATVTVPVLLWHGASDTFSPVSHVKWLAERIPNATVVVQAGAAHFGALGRTARCPALADVRRRLTSLLPGVWGGRHPQRLPSVLLGLQVAVDPLPVLQLADVRVTLAERLFKAHEHARRQLLRLIGPAPSRSVMARFA